MKYTSKELRAMQTFCQRRNARLSLCSYRTIHFQDKNTKEFYTQSLDDLLKLYEIAKKEDKLQRRQMQKDFAAKEPTL